MKRVGVSIKFPAEVHRERDTWVASCPQLHVASQGSTAEEAMAMLQEALALFIEGCCKEGIMDRVLEESGLEVGIMLANCKTAGISRARLIELLRD